eukprot:2241252-Rhodomonas_salina.8
MLSLFWDYVTVGLMMLTLVVICGIIKVVTERQQRLKLKVQSPCLRDSRTPVLADTACGGSLSLVLLLTLCVRLPGDGVHYGACMDAPR